MRSYDHSRIWPPVQSRRHRFAPGSMDSFCRSVSDISKLAMAWVTQVAIYLSLTGIAASFQIPAQISFKVRSRYRSRSSFIAA
ncbi:hypothetical protein BDV38DRAFT_231892 [Aspergillus pseudotamarii]|uniref:Uncharacterized protein n=1 Tax=Aspergillus pseudotamarii TaxID=132259 RepID=A0A5N6TBA5_ASPPS|nr:uncharacterized protein BDV38DRAFT_231892 [Aspergillus pseudotamarii]KAE8143668.1 hypothetical protein BDV38DRAFT_231892 [Aspergillus pseudotamarii]